MAAEPKRRLVVERALDLARNQQVRGKQSRDLLEGGSIVSALPQAQTCSFKIITPRTAVSGFVQNVLREFVQSVICVVRVIHK